MDVVGPDGRQVQVGPPLPPPPFGGTDVPGLYQVIQHDSGGRETKSFFAANFLNPRESQLTAGTDAGAASVGAKREPSKM